MTQLVSLLDFIHPVSSWAFWDSESGSLLCRVDKWARSDGFVGDTTNTPEMQMQLLVTNIRVLARGLLSITLQVTVQTKTRLLAFKGKLLLRSMQSRYVGCNFRPTEKQELLTELELHFHRCGSYMDQ